jgi:hypothetical protein
MDVAHGEMVEKELTRMIEKRASREPDLDEREELWKESVRHYNAGREAERRAAWANYHVGQASRLRRVMTNLVEFHEAKARQLSSETKKGTA